MKKPKELIFKDISIEPYSESYDDMGGGAFCIQVDATIYESKDLRRVIKRLKKCEEWLVQKEKYLK